MFEGKRILVLAGFGGFTKVSAEVIARNIRKCGGEVAEKAGESGAQGFDFVIVPEKTQYTKIQLMLNGKRPECPMVTPAWAIDSVQRGRIRDVNEYVVVDTELPVKRSEPETETVEEKMTPEINRKWKDGEPITGNINRKRKDGELITGNQLREDLLSTRDKFQFAKRKTDMNEHITSVLQILMDNYTLLKDRGRSFAYRAAVIALRSHPEKITSVEQVKSLRKIGDKIKKKIEEILLTGTLKRVKAMGEIGRLKAMKEFSAIWGIGSATANKLYSLGYRSISDLKANPPEILNENQRVCLGLHEEIIQRIPRAEVKQISDIVCECAKELMKSQEIVVNTCGSYRRGKETCGDIDVLITFDDVEENKEYLPKLVNMLKRKGVVTHTLVISHECKRHENCTFEGLAKLEGGLHRRLDIKIYPRKYYAWALMHFTGSANFNRSIRLFAKTKGLKLTDEGIFPAIRSHGETVCGKNLIECYTEEDIFRLFGMDYKPPEERDL
jgi:DNA polymerase/3'-5' exonuclease PolX